MMEGTKAARMVPAVLAHTIKGIPLQDGAARSLLKGPAADPQGAAQAGALLEEAVSLVGIVV